MYAPHEKMVLKSPAAAQLKAPELSGKQVTARSVEAAPDAA
jgi:hypothetical protein